VFLSDLVKCNREGREYKVYGYKGKQVRDNIHSLDVARFMAAFVGAPRAGDVYNLGGGKANSTSILEAFALAESFTGKAQVHTFVEQNRIGDHICYYSDLGKIRKHFPSWEVTQSLGETVRQIVESWRRRPHV
jgi:CDP-paratose 2-epimerase